MSCSATSTSNRRKHRVRSPLRAQICFLALLVSMLASLSLVEAAAPRNAWLTDALEKHILLEPSSKFKPSQNHGRRAQVTNRELPNRVRIAPFDLLLAPTPIQLTRSDEDLLLVDLQELIVLFIKAQLGTQNTTKLEYVLFSDIEENSWSEGKAKSQNNVPRTVMRFNGGVASFLGENIPSEEKVNDWTVQAVNQLFAAALADTHYNYIEVAEYMEITDPNATVHSGTLLVSIPSKSTNAPQQLQQNSIQPPADVQAVDDEGDLLLHALVSLLVAFSVISVALGLWIRRNNYAVRMLCLSGRDKEEIVDFSDDSPISITHETEKTDGGANGEELMEEGKSVWSKGSSVAIPQMTDTDLQHHSSLGTNCTIDERSQSTISEFTIPTVSALSFRNPNPFARGLMAQESFQKERKTNISKDMLYSSWAGGAPSLDHRLGRNHDDSVLQPSYFSAAKEWERLKKVPVAAVSESLEDLDESEDTSKAKKPFQFQAAHRQTESGQDPDGIYRISS